MREFMVMMWHRDGFRIPLWIEAANADAAQAVVAARPDCEMVVLVIPA